MKKHKNWILVILLLFGLSISACGTAPQALEARPAVEGVQQGAPSESDASESLENLDEEIAQRFVSAAAEGLSEEEIAGLSYMREEEKLAQDVYLEMYRLWGMNIFQNIARSEAAHTSAVQSLLDRYGLPDPASGMAAGEFSDPGLQALYDDLIAQGSQSLAEALKVGAAIEEIDILDLQTRLEQTQNERIRSVYQNLLQGSSKHLSAFTRTYQNRTGEVYQPQHMSAENYQSVLGGGGAGPANPGAARQGQMNGKGRRNPTQ